jgi:hypothetical protein
MPNREQRRSGELDAVKIRVTIDGNPYEFSMADISALDERDYSMANGTGRTFMEEMATGNFSSVTIAGFVWCLRRKYEKRLTFEEVLREVKISDMETLDIDDGSETEAEVEVQEPAYNGKDPELSGGSSAPASLGSPQSTG